MVTDSENSASKVEDEWGAATWAGLERAQLKAALAATPAQQLAWLEEACAWLMLPVHFRYSPEARPNLKRPSTTDRPAAIRSSAALRTAADMSAV